MKEILISRGMVVEVDDEKYDDLNRWRWHLQTSRKGGSLYASRKEYRYRPDRVCNEITVLMHRQILGVPDGVYVDHIDGNGLNNQLENLRICTLAENARNRRIGVDNSSGWKGVRPQAASSNWIARISFDNKLRHIGCFATAEEAAQAYNNAAMELHGEFANLNVVREGIVPVPHIQRISRRDVNTGRILRRVAS